MGRFRGVRVCEGGGGGAPPSRAPTPSPGPPRDDAPHGSLEAPLRAPSDVDTFNLRGVRSRLVTMDLDADIVLGMLIGVPRGVAPWVPSRKSARAGRPAPARRVAPSGGARRSISDELGPPVSISAGKPTLEASSRCGRATRGLGDLPPSCITYPRNTADLSTGSNLRLCFLWRALGIACTSAPKLVR